MSRTPLPIVLPTLVALILLACGQAGPASPTELPQEADRAKVDLFVRPPEPVERIVDEILSTPPEIVNEIKRILAAS